MTASQYVADYVRYLCVSMLQDADQGSSLLNWDDRALAALIAGMSCGLVGLVCAWRWGVAPIGSAAAVLCSVLGAYGGLMLALPALLTTLAIAKVTQHSADRFVRDRITLGLALSLLLIGVNFVLRMSLKASLGASLAKLALDISAAVISIRVCIAYARMKFRSSWWGLLGLLGPWAILPLHLLRDNRVQPDASASGRTHDHPNGHPSKPSWN
jgi:hypothetical protein